MKLNKEVGLAGILLMIGAGILLITIFFEYQVGWIGEERKDDQVPMFIFQNWSSLKWVWGWQMICYAFTSAAFFLFFRNSRGIFSIFWVILAISGIWLFAGMWIALNFYYPALKEFEAQPQLFETIRDLVRQYFIPGQLVSVLLFNIWLLVETFRKDGVIKKQTGIIFLLIVYFLISLGFYTPIAIKVSGAAVFFIPLFLGFSFWRGASRIQEA